MAFRVSTFAGGQSTEVQSNHTANERLFSRNQGTPWQSPVVVRRQYIPPIAREQCLKPGVKTCQNMLGMIIIDEVGKQFSTFPYKFHISSVKIP